MSLCVPESRNFRQYTVVYIIIHIRLLFSGIMSLVKTDKITRSVDDRIPVDKKKDPRPRSILGVSYPLGKGADSPAGIKFGRFSASPLVGDHGQSHPQRDHFIEMRPQSFSGEVDYCTRLVLLPLCTVILLTFWISVTQLIPPREFVSEALRELG